jgi:anti-sigma factor RsiW
MKCRERQTVLQEYLAGELGREEARALERHLAGCPDCARDLAGYRALLRALPSLPEAEPPATLHASLVAALARERWAWRREREPVLLTRWRRAFVLVMGGGFVVSLTIALWGWMGRIASFSALRFTHDLLSMRDAARDVWYLVTLLGRALGGLQPAVAGAADALRRVSQPLAAWGPIILASYAAALLLGSWLCWRALRPVEERGVRHASRVSVS